MVIKCDSDKTERGCGTRGYGRSLKGKIIIGIFGELKENIEKYSFFSTAKRCVALTRDKRVK